MSCPNAHHGYITKVLHNRVFFTATKFDCNSWNCSYCANKKRDKLIQDNAAWIESFNVMYRFQYDERELSSETLCERVKRSKGMFVRVLSNNSVVKGERRWVVFCTKPFKGAESIPGKDAALELALIVLGLEKPECEKGTKFIAATKSRVLVEHKRPSGFKLLCKGTYEKFMDAVKALKMTPIVRTYNGITSATIKVAKEMVDSVEFFLKGCAYNSSCFFPRMGSGYTLSKMAVDSTGGMVGLVARKVSCST